MEGGSRPTSRRRGTQSQRRAGRARRRNAGSDLGARLVAAMPAIAFALFIVGLGNWVFVAGLVVLVVFCLHELFAMFAFANPSRLAGFAGAIGAAAWPRTSATRPACWAPSWPACRWSSCCACCSRATPGRPGWR